MFDIYIYARLSNDYYISKLLHWMIYVWGWFFNYTVDTPFYIYTCIFIQTIIYSPNTNLVDKTIRGDSILAEGDALCWTFACVEINSSSAFSPLIGKSDQSQFFFSGKDYMYTSRKSMHRYRHYSYYTTYHIKLLVFGNQCFLHLYTSQITPRYIIDFYCKYKTH